MKQRERIDRLDQKNDSEVGRPGTVLLTAGGRDGATDLVLSEVLRGPVVRSSVEAFAPRCSRILTLLSCAPCWSVPVRSLGDATTKFYILLNNLWAHEKLTTTIYQGNWGTKFTKCLYWFPKYKRVRIFQFCPHFRMAVSLLRRWHRILLERVKT